VTGIVRVQKSTAILRVRSPGAAEFQLPAPTVMVGEPAGDLLLDTIAEQPFWASSRARQLRTGASTAWLLRRSSDNSTTTIGFASGAPDYAAALAFCGVGDGFIARDYNHSASGPAYIENVTLAEQPQIISAGAVLTSNGYPAYRGRNAGALSAADILGGTASNLAAFTVISEIGGAYFDIAFNAIAGQFGRVAGILPLFAGGPYYFDCGSDGGADRINGGASVADALTLVSLLNGAGGKAIWRNGTLIASNATQSTAATDVFRVGLNSTNAYHEEIVFGSAAGIALRADITASQGEKYRVTIP
jgi:hypothetical protein